MSWVVNLKINMQQTKETDRLEPKGKSPGIGIGNSSIVEAAAPAERWDLKYRVIISLCPGLAQALCELCEK